MSPRAVVFALGLFACTGRAGPEATTPAGQAAPAASGGEVGDASAGATGEPAAAPAAPALRELPPLALSEARAEARPRLFLRAAWGAALAPGFERAVVFGFGRGFSIDDAGRRSLTARQDLYAASYAPDGSRVAMVGARAFLVADAQSGQRVASFAIDRRSQGSPEMRAIRFLSADELAFFDGCRLRRAVLGGEARAIGPELCGRPYPSDDGRRWLIWSRGDTGAVAVHALDLDTGAHQQVLGGSADVPGLSVFSAAPDAGAFCFSRRRDRSAFTCREVGGAETVAWEGVTDGRPVFVGPRRVAFGAGALRSERPLVIVDLAAGTRQRVGTLGRGEEWLDALSPEQILASGDDRVLLFDLAAGRRLHIDLGRGEWEGLVVRPGADRFLIGRERRATRDLYWVAIPR